MPQGSFVPASTQLVLGAPPHPYSTQVISSQPPSHVKNSPLMVAVPSPPPAPPVDQSGVQARQKPVPPHVPPQQAIVIPPQQGYTNNLPRFPQHQSGAEMLPDVLSVPFQPQESLLLTQSNFCSQPSATPKVSAPPALVLTTEKASASCLRPAPRHNTMLAAKHPAYRPPVQEGFFPSTYQEYEKPPLTGADSSFPQKAANDDVTLTRIFSGRGGQGAAPPEGERGGGGEACGIPGPVLPRLAPSPLPSNGLGDVGPAEAWMSFQRSSAFGRSAASPPPQVSSPVNCLQGGGASLEAYNLITGPLRGRNGKPLRPVTVPEPPVRLSPMHSLCGVTIVAL